MHARKLSAELKTVLKDTAWREGELPPRYSGVFSRSKKMGRGWKWRTLYLQGAVNEFLLLLQCNAMKDDRMAWLILKNEGGYSVVSRFENHGTHPGLHIHSNCKNIGLVTGPDSIEAARYPTGGTFHRRQLAWTDETFFEAAVKRFGIESTDKQTRLV